MPYTSRDEIATAVQSAVQEKVTRSLDDTDDLCVSSYSSSFLPVHDRGRRITEDDLERYMMTNLAGSPPLDILIRSSGVRRLSDFLTWQVRFNFQSDAERLMTYELFAGFGKRPAPLYSDVLARYWILGPISGHSGLSDEGVESTG